MKVLADYYRCPADRTSIGTRPDLSADAGFFKFGEATGFGRVAGAQPMTHASAALPNLSDHIEFSGGRASLPFNLDEVAKNLREERYRQNGYSFLQKTTSGSVAQRLYYQFRPLMGVQFRKHLQRVRLKGWDRIAFPKWPVDRSVDVLMENAMIALLKAQPGASIPFIWFWPDGAAASAMVTHDVEGQSGIDFCDQLMDLDDVHGIKSAFQLIPEGREDIWRRTAAKLRARGFEVNLHDLNHDGRLFADRAAFARYASRINDYARKFGSDGFRSGAMYREQSWYDAFEFSYDMSVPNAAHLEPQRGGCCTVMPYFVGQILELPLTMTQDYSLFHILNDYSTTLWKEQMRIVREQHGLISVIAHPDYLLGQRERDVYTALLRELCELREHGGVWIALPGDINHWWRNRQRMVLAQSASGWRIEGPDSHRARVAYAGIDRGELVYTFEAPRIAASHHATRA